ncbi:MAG: hypothetical protein ACKVLK_17240 [Spongiibacter sp.]
MVDPVLPTALPLRLLATAAGATIPISLTIPIIRRHLGCVRTAVVSALRTSTRVLRPATAPVSVVPTASALVPTARAGVAASGAPVLHARVAPLLVRRACSMRVIRIWLLLLLLLALLKHRENVLLSLTLHLAWCVNRVHSHALPARPHRRGHCFAVDICCQC